MYHLPIDPNTYPTDHELLNHWQHCQWHVLPTVENSVAALIYKLDQTMDEIICFNFCEMLRVYKGL